MPKNSINDIAALVARKQKISKKEAADIVAAFFNTIADGLREDRQVKVRGLGTFKITAVKARESVNVNTGERVVIEGHDKVSFVPDQSMKDLVNKPFADFTTVVVNDGVNFDSVDAAAAAEERKVTAMQEQEQEDELDEQETDEQTEASETDEEDDSLKTDEQTGQTETDSLKADEQTGQKEASETDESLKTDEQTEQTEASETDEDTESLKDDEAQEQTEEVFKSEVPDSNRQIVVDELDDETAEQPEDESGEQSGDESVGSQTTEESSVAGVTSITGQSVNVGNSEKEEENNSKEEENEEDDLNVSREYFDEQMASCRRRCNRNLVLSLVLLLVGLVSGFFIGRYTVLPDFASNKEVKDTSAVAKVEKEKPAEKPVAVPEPKDTAQPVDTPKVEKKTEEKVEEPAPKPTETEEDDVDPDIKKLNSDRRLRFGAYEIVGVDKVVRLKKGQTMQSYSNKTLGKDMVVYFQVLNGVNEVKAGETLKVPKIRLKKQYRK